MKSRILVPLLAATFLSGCASTIEDRRNERLAAYSEMPLETKSLVNSGQIKVGMTKDAVYIAWGKPAQVVQSESPEGRSEIWVYHGSALRPYQYWDYGYHGWGPFYHRYHYSSLPYLETDWYPQYYVSAEVTFQNDRVVNWRSLPHPPY